MAESKTKTEKRTCVDCHKEFEAIINLVTIGDSNYEFGGNLCKVCQKTREEKQDSDKKVMQQISIIKQRREWRIQCGIPSLFQNKTFETFEQKLQPQPFKQSKEYADRFPLEKSSRGYQSLILYSPHPCYGLGKTHLLSSIGHRILDRWQGETTSCPIMFTTETDILLRIRATYNINHIEGIWHEKEQDIYEKLETVNLLLFDDVGKEQPSDVKFTQRVYFNVIDGRYHRNLPIVLTSNLDLNQMSDYIGMAATDRLVEMAKNNIVELKGDSYRRKK